VALPGRAIYVISLRHHGRQGSKEQEGCRFGGFDGFGESVRFDGFGESVGFDGFLIHEALVRSTLL